MRGGQVAAGRQRVEERRDGGRRLGLVVDEVQDGDEDEPDRLAEVQHLPHRRRRQDGRWIPEVGLDVGGAALGR
jgi:hypothetical protein